MNNRVKKRLWVPIVLLLVACSGQSFSLAETLPGERAVSDWTPSGDVQSFDAETLYDLVDGQADAFFVYNFESVAVQSYENAEGTTVRIEVWQLAKPASAYGLFSTYRAGTPVSIGNEGDSEPGRRLSFWQDRYFVHLFAQQPLTDDVLRTFAEAIAEALPADGKRPALVDRLPQEGLVERSAVFFHQEMSIQNYLWLGGQNLLGLSAETDGVLARYDTDDGIAQVLLVQFPDAASASAGLDVLQKGQVGGLVAAQRHENLLGAVFGAADETTASEWATTALRE